MKNTNKIIAHERLRELLDYNPETGEFFWRVARGRCAKKGGRAGRPRLDGRWHIELENRDYLASRLAVFWMDGEWPAHDIDHINGNCGDDRRSNLRNATESQNGGNRRGNRNKLSGLPKGVFQKGKRYAARIRKDRKLIHIGSFATPEEAHHAYCESAIRLYGEFWCRG